MTSIETAATRAPVSAGVMLHALRIIVPSAWLGLLVALAFIGTPLRFISAADVAGVVFAIALAALAFSRPRMSGLARWVVGAIWLVLAVQLAGIRPFLGAPTDLVLAGIAPGGWPLHLVYVVADGLIVLLLGTFLVVCAREYFGLRWRWHQRKRIHEARGGGAA